MTNEYSKALFELSNEYNNLESTKESFDAFIVEYKDDFKKLLLSPNISKLEKKEVVKKCFNSCNETFIYFLSVVIDNSRVDLFDEIYKDFIKLINKKNNVVNIDVFSSEALTDEANEKISDRLTNVFQGKKVIINNLIDEKLLGGYKIFHNGVQIDGSLKNQLEMLKANL